MTLHFAYGSNMSRPHMRTRCPGARALGTTTLAGWRFIIGLDGFASLARQPESVVVPSARAPGQRARMCGRLMFDP